jgi:uncharacterized protein YbaR (Trm112 family)
MKPWLFDILACPIDKYFPLKLYIFTYETNDATFKSYLEMLKSKNIDKLKKENIIKTYREDGKVFLKDNVIIEKNPIKKYISLIISSIDELTNIYDLSTYEYSKKCFKVMMSQVKNNIIEFEKINDIEKLDSILPELYFINKIKVETEIETGILFCEECNRWYPIIDTIPQMLPDEYRDEKKEISFLRTNKNLLDEEFLKQNLKPFNL